MATARDAAPIGRPAQGSLGFSLYLGALLLLPFKWLSPFSYAQAGLTDLLAAAAVALWVVEAILLRRRVRLRAPHWCYAAYVLAVGVSALLTADASTARQNVLITLELVALAVLTADYARSPERRRLIARVILLVVWISATEAAYGLILFYLGHQTSLVSSYSGYFRGSSLYTRVQAGFYSPALLGSFTIFASAVIALEDNGLSRRTHRVAQVALALLALSTISRSLISFVVALALRELAQRRSAKARRAAVTIVAVAILALASLTVLPLSVDPLRPASSPAGINPRLSLIKTAARTLVHHPLFGEGPGALVATWDSTPLRAHVTPLNVAATTGIVSAASLAALLVVLWRRRRVPTNVALWAGLAGLGLDGMTQDVEHFRHVWLMFGLLDADREAPNRR